MVIKTHIGYILTEGFNRKDMELLWVFIYNSHINVVFFLFKLIMNSFFFK